MTENDSEFYTLVKCLVAIVAAAIIAISFYAFAYTFVDRYTYSQERYQLETERLKLQQKLCTPENLITEEGN